MTVIVECDRTDCGMAFEAGTDEGDWSPAPGDVASFALDDTGYGGLVYVYLPEGWATERVGVNQVIHCPAHTLAALVDDPPPRSAMPTDMPDDSRRYWGD